MHHRPSHCGLGCCWEACAQSLAPNAMRTASSASSTDAHFLSSLARHRIGRRSSTCRSSALLCTTRLSRVPLASRACRAGDVVMGCRGCSAAPSEREIARPYFSRGHGAVMYTVPGYLWGMLGMSRGGSFCPHRALGCDITVRSVRCSNTYTKRRKHE